MTEYKGGSDNSRVRHLEKEREKLLKESNEAKARIARETAIQYTDVKSRFDIKTDVIEDQFKSRTVGYKTRDEFIQTGKQLEQERQLSLLEKQKNEKKRELESAVKKKSEKQKLSFLNHDDDEEEDDDDDDDDADDGEKNSDNDNDKATKNGDTQATKKPKMMKNPFIDTTFLPDREREQKEEELKKKLLAEWQAEQDKIKSEVIEVTYSYWDGHGHRKTTKVTKGATIDTFLGQVRNEFKELRAVPSENLMYVKEDLIIPSHYTFYDLIVTKARGKSGPLFHFDVHDDVRLLNDATVEKDESHAGKVCERRWYESNKHLFPASRWEIFDPAKTYDKYTISDSKK